MSPQRRSTLLNTWHHHAHFLVLNKMNEPSFLHRLRLDKLDLSTSTSTNHSRRAQSQLPVVQASEIKNETWQLSSTQDPQAHELIDTA